MRAATWLPAIMQASSSKVAKAWGDRAAVRGALELMRAAYAMPEARPLLRLPDLHSSLCGVMRLRTFEHHLTNRTP
jgi:hypothetical protein